MLFVIVVIIFMVGVGDINIGKFDRRFEKSFDVWLMFKKGVSYFG